MCLATNYNVEGIAGCHTLLMLSFWAPNVTTLYSFPLATRCVYNLFQRHYFSFGGQVRRNRMTNYTEQRLLRHCLKLDNLQVDEFKWLPYMDPRILSRVPMEFLGHPHGDFYTAVVLLIFFRWIEILNIDRVLRQFRGKQGPSNLLLKYLHSWLYESSQSP
ncbi:hypothetical protein Ahy_B08g091082 [Arachis hypogaea]|uniref:Aminotransferase-like plant mobile domain-containing protein n=1 Tax=Arachis hypogaea TaxID=3818 RepID=A0A444Y1C2_ARAHY|nr:hypothetical protein Ahy_B08g091082 [Arachis hypogaea]